MSQGRKVKDMNLGELLSSAKITDDTGVDHSVAWRIRQHEGVGTLALLSIARSLERLANHLCGPERTPDIHKPGKPATPRTAGLRNLAELTYNETPNNNHKEANQ